MPDGNTKQFVLEFVTNAAEASYEVQTLGKNLDDLGDKQQKEAAREKDANEQRTRAAANLRQILEAMLGQLKQMNAALGDVSAASVRTADTAEKAFKKAMVINRALRMEKQRGDREEAKRQKDAQDNFVVEQSRNHDRLRTLKLLAAGGAVIGVGKMALGIASDFAGRGMSFVNAGALTGVDTKYMQGLNLLIKGRGGAEGAAVQALGALSQTLFNIQRGYANPDAAAAQYLGNAPWRGSPQEFLEYLAERLPQLSPQEAVAATSGLGLSPELIAMLREAGGAEGWRKMMAEAMRNVPDLAKDAKDAQQFLAKLSNGVDKIKQYAEKILAWLNRHLPTKTIENIGTGGTVAGGVLSTITLWKILSRFFKGAPGQSAPPVPPGAPPAPGAPKPVSPPKTLPSWLYQTPRYFGPVAALVSVAALAALSHYIKNRAMDKLKEKYDAPPTTDPVKREMEINRELMRRMNTQVSNPLGFVSGRDYFNLTHGGGGNTDNSRQYAVNVENINITTRDDPAAVADATQDALGAAALRLIDRHTAGVYNV